MFEDVLFAYVDPVNTGLLIIIWWRIERQSKRLDRLETKLMTLAIDTEVEDRASDMAND